jgi:cation transport ATPase
VVIIIALILTGNAFEARAKRQTSPRCARSPRCSRDGARAAPDAEGGRRGGRARRAVRAGDVVLVRPASACRWTARW